MESGLSGIFRVKLVTKNLERGSSGTQFMHMRVKLNENLHKWDINTTLLVGDSMLSGIEERRISKRDRKVKVKNFRGATIDDMYDYIKPLLKNVLIM